MQLHKCAKLAISQIWEIRNFAITKNFKILPNLCNWIDSIAIASIWRLKAFQSCFIENVDMQKNPEIFLKNIVRIYSIQLVPLILSFA